MRLRTLWVLLVALASAGSLASGEDANRGRITIEAVPTPAALEHITRSIVMPEVDKGPFTERYPIKRHSHS